MLRFFFPHEWPLPFCLCKPQPLWTVCALLTLPPTSLVPRQLQLCPFQLNTLCRWKLSTTLQHEPQSHAGELGSTGGLPPLDARAAGWAAGLLVPDPAWGSGTQRPNQAAASEEKGAPEGGCQLRPSLHMPMATVYYSTLNSTEHWVREGAQGRQAPAAKPDPGTHMPGES